MATHRIDVSKNSLPDLKSQLLYVSEAEYGEDWQSLPHIHPFCEIFYVIKGHGNFWIDEKTYPVKEDDVILVNANVNHTEMAVNNQPFSYIALGVSGIDFVTMYKEKFVIHNYADYKHEVLFYLKNILIEAKERSEHYQDIANKYLDILLINLMRRSSSLLVETSSETKINLECSFVKKHIDRNYGQEITLESLAEMTHTSKFYLAHAFKEYTGQSIIDYLIMRRTEEACNLMKTTNHSISNIASLVGYSSASYFSAAFNKRMGMSPLKYKQKLLKE